MRSTTCTRGPVSPFASAELGACDCGPAGRAAAGPRGGREAAAPGGRAGRRRACGRPNARSAPQHFTGLVAAIALLATLALPAAATPRPGCYDRTYSAAHLKANPQQHVARIRLWLDPRGDHAELSVWTAMQGRALPWGDGGKRFGAALVCWSEGGQDLCGVECDGGVARLTLKGDTLDLRTRRLMVGETDDCGGILTLQKFPTPPSPTA